MKGLQMVYDINGYKKLRRIYNPFGYTHYVISDFLSRNIELKSGNKVLDAGCGYGFISKAIHENAVSLGIYIDQYAFDLSDSMPDAFRDYVQASANIKVADARNTGYQDNMFDIIICSGMFEHIENPLEVLNEFRRCLKKEGQLLLLISTKSPMIQFQNYLFFGNAGSDLYRSYKYREFLPYIEQAGFKNIERRYFSLKFFLVNHSLFAVKAKA